MLKSKSAYIQRLNAVYTVTANKRCDAPEPSVCSASVTRSADRMTDADVPRQVNTLKRLFLLVFYV